MINVFYIQLQTCTMMATVIHNNNYIDIHSIIQTSVHIL